MRLSKVSITIITMLVLVIAILTYRDTTFRKQTNRQQSVFSTWLVKYADSVISIQPELYSAITVNSANRLHLIAPSITFAISDPIESITEKNIIWSSQIPGKFVLTYIPANSSPQDKTAHLVALSHTSTSPIKIDLGSGAFYGINEDQAFRPVISPDEKLIAVQTELIHYISIYDFEGNHIANLPTKYADVELFSPEMYELENGNYSPFLEYGWNSTGTGILYRFTSDQDLPLHEVLL